VAHLVLPDEVQVQASDGMARAAVGRVSARRQPSDPAQLSEAVRLIGEARRPVLVVGHGAVDAGREVVELAEHLGAPVLTTFRAKGLVPDSHPLGAGVLGRSGTPVASWLMNESDLVIAVGVSFSHHTGVADYKPIVQVDDTPSAIGRFHAVTAPVLGDAAVVLPQLLVATPAGDDAQRRDLAERWQLWRDEKARRRTEDRGRGLNAAAVFDALGRHLPHEAVVCVDVGNHAYSLGRYLESAGQPVLMSGYLGSIGFGYPAAIGAWAADPSRPVVAVTGDGGYGQYAMELTTAVKYGIPVKHVLLDNHGLGKISKEQVAGDFPVWQTSLVNPDWAAFARLCGATGLAARSAPELDNALSALFAADGPALLAIEQDGELV
jgi:thiamine pyrophosphate-dependent acetolactate synthase large subunit-like protein